MISSAHYSTVYIDPYTTDSDFYITYNIDQVPATGGYECLVEDTFGPELPIETTESLRNARSEEHTSELQSRPHLVCRLLLEKKNNYPHPTHLYQNSDACE